MRRTASAMLAFATRRIARAASVSVEPSGSPMLRGSPRSAASRSSVIAAADQLAAEAAQDQVGVGVRRLLPAAAVARGPGIGARGLRAVAQRPGSVDPRERAAAGADGEDLDAREADRVAVLDGPLVRGAHLALVDERDVRARAAHVERRWRSRTRTARRCGRQAIAPAAIPEAAIRPASCRDSFAAS